MAAFSTNIEAYAQQCEQQRIEEGAFMIGVLDIIRGSVRVRTMAPAEKAALHRAATRAFGPHYKIVDLDMVRFEGRNYHYNSITGRFYGLHG